MDREGAVVTIIVELHLRGVKTGFTFDEIANFGVFNNHFGPKWIAGEAEKVVAAGSTSLNDDISPTSNDVFSVLDFGVFEGLSNNLVERVFSSKKY